MSGVVFSVVYQGGVEVSREQKVPLPQEVTLPNVGSAGLYGTREGGAQSGAGVTGGKAGRRKSTELLELKEALQMHKAAPADRLVDAHFEQEAAERRAVLEEAARIQREVCWVVFLLRGQRHLFIACLSESRFRLYDRWPRRNRERGNDCLIQEEIATTRQRSGAQKAPRALSVRCCHQRGVEEEV